MKNKKGISLIVLVITIIVMIILAASVVITLSNTGIIDKADKATNKTNKNQVKTLASVYWAEAYMSGLRDDKLVEYVEDKLKNDKINLEDFNLDVTSKGVEDKEPQMELIVPEGYIYTVASTGEELTGGTKIMNGCLGFDTIRKVDGDLIYTLTQDGFYTLDEAKYYAKQYYIVELRKMGYSWEEFLAANSMTEEDAWKNLGLTEENFIPSTIVTKGWQISEVEDKTKTTYEQIQGNLLGYDLILLDNTFINCSNLTTIDIPKGVVKLNNVFENCTSLVNISLPDTLKEMTEGVFKNCSNITNLTLPEGLEIINGEVFNNCSNLENILLPKSLKKLTGGPFENCLKLTDVVIPESLVECGNNVFNGCPGIYEIKVADGNENYISIDGVLYTKDKLNLVDYPDGKSDKEYVILSGVTVIERGIFSNNTILEKIIIPNSVITLSIDVFAGCTSLKDVVFEENSQLKNIYNSCFRNCKSLTQLNIPQTVESISPYAFDGCKLLTEIIIPDKVTTIGFGTFMNCNSLKKITLPAGLKSIGNLAFRDSSLSNVYFKGTEEQWDAITIGTYNTGLTNANKTFNYVDE